MHKHFEECTLGGKANKSIVYMLTFEAKNGCMLAHTNGKSQPFNCLAHNPQAEALLITWAHAESFSMAPSKRCKTAVDARPLDCSHNGSCRNSCRFSTIRNLQLPVILNYHMLARHGRLPRSPYPNDHSPLKHYEQPVHSQFVSTGSISRFTRSKSPSHLLHYLGIP